MVTVSWNKIKIIHEIPNQQFDVRVATLILIIAITVYPLSCLVMLCDRIFSKSDVCSCDFEDNRFNIQMQQG